MYPSVKALRRGPGTNGSGMVAWVSWRGRGGEVERGIQERGLGLRGFPPYCHGDVLVGGD